jgi:hypothetical protein
MGRPRLILLAALVLLAGCPSTSNERVRVRRAPEIVEKEEARVRPGEYEAYLTRLQEEHEARRLTRSLKEEAAWYAATSASVDAIRETIGEDPWATYEKDRLDTLHRNWADADLPPPEPEKDVLDEAAAAEDEEEEEEGDDAGEDEDADEDEDEEYDDDEDW